MYAETVGLPHWGTEASRFPYKWCIYFSAVTAFTLNFYLQCIGKIALLFYDKNTVTLVVKATRT